jgi:hypothetical protein
MQRPPEKERLLQPDKAGVENNDGLLVHDNHPDVASSERLYRLQSTETRPNHYDQWSGRFALFRFRN